DGGRCVGGKGGRRRSRRGPPGGGGGVGGGGFGPPGCISVPLKKSRPACATCYSVASRRRHEESSKGQKSSLAVGRAKPQAALQALADRPIHEPTELAQLARLVFEMVPKVPAFAEQRHGTDEGQVQQGRPQPPRLPGVPALVRHDLARRGDRERAGQLAPALVP